MDEENYMSRYAPNPRLFTMAIKSENSPISNAFWPGTNPILYESVCSVCVVVEHYWFHKVVIAQFSAKPYVYPVLRA